MSYSTVTINAAKVTRDYNISSIATWKLFAENAFPQSKSRQDKGCPKNTFLSLCQQGKVKGIPAGAYTTSINNQRYALNALSILHAQPDKNFSASELWKAVMELEDDRNKAPNGQMEVVLTLWQAGLLNE